LVTLDSAASPEREALYVSNFLRPAHQVHHQVNAVRRDDCQMLLRFNVQCVSELRAFFCAAISLDCRNPPQLPVRGEFEDANWLADA